jgi:hypothetical protein
MAVPLLPLRATAFLRRGVVLVRAAVLVLLPLFAVSLSGVPVLVVASALALPVVAVPGLAAPVCVSVFVSEGASVFASVFVFVFASDGESVLVPEFVPVFRSVFNASVLVVASGSVLSVAPVAAEPPPSTAAESPERASCWDCFVRAEPPVAGDLADPCAALGMAGLTSMSGVGT